MLCSYVHSKKVSFNVEPLYGAKEAETSKHSSLDFWKLHIMVKLQQCFNVSSYFDNILEPITTKHGQKQKLFCTGSGVEKIVDCFF